MDAIYFTGSYCWVGNPESRALFVACPVSHCTIFRRSTCGLQRGSVLRNIDRLLIHAPPLPVSCYPATGSPLRSARRKLCTKPTWGTLRNERSSDEPRRYCQRALTLTEAITLHGGEAQEARDEFMQALDVQEKETLQARFPVSSWRRLSALQADLFSGAVFLRVHRPDHTAPETPEARG